jgi:hypothetical protein
MTTDPKLRKRGKLKVASLIAIVAVVGLFAFVKMNPVIFNESFFEHAHCITIADAALEMYAQEYGHWPYHTNGFGDAVLLTIENAWMSFTGPGFDDSELLSARASGRDVDENKLGRIYIQECRFFSEWVGTNVPSGICYLFDQVATPGDHVHLLGRLWAPPIREVLELGTSLKFVRDDEWYAYATNQIELLVAAGLDRRKARHYYEMTGLTFDE